MLATRAAISARPKTRVNLFHTTPRKTIISKRDASIEIKEITPEQAEKNRLQLKKKLPTSPHVTIYKFPLPAISSITNRVTGVMLTAVYITRVNLLTGFFGGGAITALYGPDALPCIIESIQASFALPLVKLAVAFPLTYHTLGGFRHMYWDLTNKGLDLESVNNSSRNLFGISAALSLVLSFVSL